MRRPLIAAGVVAAALSPLLGCARPSLAAPPTPVAAPAAAPAPYCHDGACHPVNAGGYVTDGSPQRDDGHCEEQGQTTRQVVSCLVARRPECRDWTQDMSRQTATACWAPEVNAYPWDHQAAFDALFCESRGQEHVSNGNHFGLLQSTDWEPDAASEFEDAFWTKYQGQGPSAWRATWGVYCAG